MLYYAPFQLLCQGQIFLPGLILLLEVFYVRLRDLDEEDAIDDVEHVEHAAHAWWLDLDGRQAALGLALVDIVHLLLQHHRLLGQVSQALARLPGLVMFIAQLGLVDRERLLLVGQGRPEVAHATLGPCNQVVAHSNLQAPETKR